MFFEYLDFKFFYDKVPELVGSWLNYTDYSSTFYVNEVC